MKKTILTAALSIVVSVAPAYGQGSIAFNNYGVTTDAIVRPVGFGTPVGLGFTAGLRYGFGTITDQNLLTLSGITQSFNPSTPGYFQGPIVTIPGYTGGPITFQVLAYNGLDYNSSIVRGSSCLFTLQSIATGTQPVDEFGAALKPFYVGGFSDPTCVPEPSTVGLIGLGFASLLVLRFKR